MARLASVLWIVIGVLAAGVLCVAYGIVVEHHWYRVRRYRLDILPAGAAQLSVLHVSDLHFVRSDRKLRELLASLPACDVVVATGDLIGEPEAVEDVVAALAPVRGRMASLFVLGSNDYYQPRPVNPLRYFRQHRPGKRRLVRRSRADDLVEQLEAGGWVHLKNLHGVMTFGSLDAEVMGMDDPHIHRGDLRVAPRERRDLFGLAVVHSPDPSPELAALGWDLILAGHTHGGQVRMPVVGTLVTNSHMPRRLAFGVARMGRATLHTSPGLGTSKFAPFRFLCRPEATILELQPATAPVAGEAHVAGAATR